MDNDKSTLVFRVSAKDDKPTDFSSAILAKAKVWELSQRNIEAVWYPVRLQP